MTVALAWCKISTLGFYRPFKYVVILFSLLFLLASLTLSAHAAQVTLAWDADTAPGVTGYKLHYGTQSRNYSFVVNAGNSTTSVVSSLQTGTTYYFAVTAYDAAGVESGYSNEVSYSISADATLPVVTSFIIPSTGTSLTVPITAFTATDNVGVTGYLLTQTSSKPAASAIGWTTTPPTSYTFFTGGTETLYAWAKDAAGNVSASVFLTITITVSSTLYASFEGYGVYKWDGVAWTQFNTIVPTNMTASGSSLYATFTGQHGVWEWNGTTWTQRNAQDPANMAASGSSLYATFPGHGVWEWNGTTWTQRNAQDPANMAASGSSLYATFPGRGVWEWNGIAWTRRNHQDPANMAASGSSLYATFPGHGVWEWNGTTWTQLNAQDPANMAASGSFLYATFPGHGVWQRNGTTWTQLNAQDPANMAAGLQ